MIFITQSQTHWQKLNRLPIKGMGQLAFCNSEQSEPHTNHGACAKKVTWASLAPFVQMYFVNFWRPCFQGWQLVHCACFCWSFYGLLPLCVGPLCIDNVAFVLCALWPRPVCLLVVCHTYLLPVSCMLLRPYLIDFGFPSKNCHPGGGQKSMNISNFLTRAKLRHDDANWCMRRSSPTFFFFFFFFLQTAKKSDPPDL